MATRKSKPRPFDNVEELTLAMEDARALMPEDDGAVTTAELAERWKCSLAGVRQILRAMQVEGRLEQVKAWRETLDGRRRVSAYKVRVS